MMPLTGQPSLDWMLEQAAKKLGSHAATLEALGVSRQRVYSARNGGPPLRVARLLQLGLLADVDPVLALHAGGQCDVATLLDISLRPRDADITPTERKFLRAVRELPPDLQSSVVHHVESLAAAIANVDRPTASWTK